MTDPCTPTTADRSARPQAPSPVNHVQTFLGACNSQPHALKLLEAFDSLPHLTHDQQLGFLECVRLAIEESRR